MGSRDQNIFYWETGRSEEHAAGRLITAGRKYFYRSGTVKRLGPLTRKLVFTYNKKEERVVSVEEMPAFECYVSFTRETKSRCYEYRKGWSSSEDSERWEEIEGTVMRNMPNETVSSCGPSCLAGYAYKRKEIRHPEEKAAQEAKKIGMTGHQTGFSEEVLRWKLHW